MDNKIIINEVGPRDGLQNQSKILTTADRIKLINKLLDAGVSCVEVGSFVSPKAVPAMAETDVVVANLTPNRANYSALIPNRKGYDIARKTGIKSLAMVVAASETMNLRNIRMSTEEAMSVSRDVIEIGCQERVSMLAYVATAWECPFEGIVAEQTVVRLVGQLFDAGAAEVVIADTIGAANPMTVKSLMECLVKNFGSDRLSCHFHDTRGMGVANVFAAVQSGIRKFDSSIGGLGGCPFSPGASGNVATEDVVVMLDQMGYETGIDLRELVSACDLAVELTGSRIGGKSVRWLKRQIEKNLL
jgi:hydroxymethylglutaryl-CoA lyase